MNIPTVFLLAFLAYLGAALAKDRMVVCYYANWSPYRPSKGQFQIEDIQTALCTHLIYSYIGIKADGSISILDPWQDLPDDSGKAGFQRFNQLRAKNPSLKTLVSIGGWNQGSINFSQVARNDATRATFVANAVSFLKKYGFNGLDVAWSYPAQNGGLASDKKNYVKLLKELRQAFDKENLILTIAAAGPKIIAREAYIIPEVSQHVHYINIQAYDLNHGAYTVTALNAPLYSTSKHVSVLPMETINSSVSYWIENGAPANKIILGLPSYGRSFILGNPRRHGLAETSTGPGTPGTYTRQPGLLSYYEICTMLSSGGWNIVRDVEAQVPYAYRDEDWVSYDDVTSIRAKAEYIKKKGLAGATLWSLDTDDFAGLCGDEYPLLTALNDALNASDPVPTTTSKPPSPSTTPKPPPPPPSTTSKPPPPPPSTTPKPPQPSTKPKLTSNSRYQKY